MPFDTRLERIEIWCEKTYGDFQRVRVHLTNGYSSPFIGESEEKARQLEHFTFDFSKSTKEIRKIRGWDGTGGSKNMTLFSMKFMDEGGSDVVPEFVRTGKSNRNYSELELGAEQLIVGVYGQTRSSGTSYIDRLGFIVKEPDNGGLPWAYSKDSQ